MGNGIPAPAVALARARLAGMHRHGAPDPDNPALIAAQQDFKTAKLADYIVRVVSTWPPLSDEQLDHVAAMLRAGGRAHPPPGRPPVKPRRRKPVKADE